MILNLSFIISSKRISETKKKNKFTFLIPIILKFYKIRQCRNTYIVSHLKIRIEISRVINRASKQNTASLFATRRNLSFSYRTKRKLNYPVPIVSTKIGPPAERKERRRRRRKGREIFRQMRKYLPCIGIIATRGGKILKKREAKIPASTHRPSRAWNISRAFAYWDASGVKLFGTSCFASSGKSEGQQPRRNTECLSIRIVLG